MVVPFAAYISYVDLSVRPLIHVRGSTHRSDPVSTKHSIFVTRSVTKRRLALGPSLFAAFSVGTSRFPTENCMAVCISLIGRRRSGGTNSGPSLLVTSTFVAGSSIFFVAGSSIFFVAGSSI